jgi:hypothetical protein
MSITGSMLSVRNTLLLTGDRYIFTNDFMAKDGRVHTVCHWRYRKRRFSVVTDCEVPGVAAQSGLGYAKCSG